MSNDWSDDLPELPEFREGESHIRTDAMSRRRDTELISCHFNFTRHPTGDGGPIEVSVTATAEAEAWRKIAQQFELPVEEVRKLVQKMQMEIIRPGDIEIQSPGPQESSAADPWPGVVTDSVRNVTGAIKDSFSAAREEDSKIELEIIRFEKFILTLLISTFLCAMLFSFYLVSIDKMDPVFKFLFPLMMTLVGIIGGYLGGKKIGRRPKET